MSHDTESTTHPATRLDDDDPVPGQDSPAHDIRGTAYLHCNCNVVVGVRPNGVCTFGACMLGGV